MSKRRAAEILAALAAAMAGCGHSNEPQPQPQPQREQHQQHQQHQQGEHRHAGHFEHRFSDAERWARVFDDPARDAWQKPTDVIDLLEITPGMVAVDIGAGTGYFLPHLSNAVGPEGSVTGLDVEPDMVRHMTERIKKAGMANAAARVVAGDDPGLAPGSVDRILIVNTWHHIPNRRAYSARLRAALEPGGLVAVVDYTADAPRGPPAKHRIPPEVVIDELAAGGLRGEVATESLPYQYVVIGRM